jgi:DNA-binding NtrC family response regulator
MTGSILVVDDDPAILTSLSEALRAEGHDVAVAANGARAIDALRQREPDVILSDVRMEELDGLGLLRLVRERGIGSDVVLMTAFDDMDTVASAMRAGAAEFLVKPLHLDHLLAVLSRILEDRRLRTRRKRSRGEARIGDIVGRDPRMIQVYKLIGHAAASRATVLVRGESGTGKELIARAIHAHSSATREPFVAVNCTALPSMLLESELFGHVRGAFTGAIAARRGAFAQAGSGTIFLDEIGDTSTDFQSKILRVVQNHEFQPVGSERLERTEARVIAATHQNLEELIRAGRFREDLYFRLRVLEITVPPLRDRSADLPLLAEHLVRRASELLGCREPVLSNEAVSFLEKQSWPGNVRELENTLLRAVVLASTAGVIRLEHLHMSVASRADSVDTLEQNERAHIQRVLIQTDGHKANAAKLLGVSRPRLNRLLRKHRLE